MSEKKRANPSFEINRTVFFFSFGQEGVTDFDLPAVFMETKFEKECV